jgi:hypothetical protein
MTMTLNAMKGRYDVFVLGAGTAQSDREMGLSCVTIVRDGTNGVGLGNPHDTLARFARAGIIRWHGQRQISVRCAFSEVLSSV